MNTYNIHYTNDIFILNPDITSVDEISINKNNIAFVFYDSSQLNIIFRHGHCEKIPLDKIYMVEYMTHIFKFMSGIDQSSDYYIRKGKYVFQHNGVGMIINPTNDNAVCFYNKYFRSFKYHRNTLEIHNGYGAHYDLFVAPESIDYILVDLFHPIIRNKLTELIKSIKILSLDCFRRSAPHRIHYMDDKIYILNPDNTDAISINKNNIAFVFYDSSQLNIIFRYGHCEKIPLDKIYMVEYMTHIFKFMSGIDQSSDYYIRKGKYVFQHNGVGMIINPTNDNAVCFYNKYFRSFKYHRNTLEIHNGYGAHYDLYIAPNSIDNIVAALFPLINQNKSTES